MYKIAVLGDRDSVLGFKALGLDIFPVEGTDEARQTLHRLAKEDYAIIYVEENLAADPDMAKEIARYKDDPKPAVILIPGRDGPLGLGQKALEEAVERAVGSNIL